ncbi:MAG: lecithin retinol acyltransferase family protein [Lachnospiraceae bacterium]|nr:lecithin retinol acyltransferase family protein [Lachnospiraceae bacterium]
MKWSVREGKLGDMVRVHCNDQLDHYGVYVSDTEVIQFGKNPSLRTGATEAHVLVLSTDINEFRNGTFPEFADMSFSEKLKRINPNKTVEIARSRIGESGYNIIHNNCEHFAYECVFGKKYSSQEEKVRELVKLTATGKMVKGDES